MKECYPKNSNVIKAPQEPLQGEGGSLYTAEEMQKSEEEDNIRI